MKHYPADQISRSLDPESRAFTTVVGRHDRRLTDADINLLQDVQDGKRKALLDTALFSGMLGYEPFVMSHLFKNSFNIKSFQALFNGEVVDVKGANSADPTISRVILPDPAYWTSSLPPAEKARIYVVYLELWYNYLDVESGSGYYTDASGLRYIYPNGCVDAPFEALLPDDVIDPFEGLHTTSRVQVQWALRTARLPLAYDFSQRPSGLDRGSGLSEVVYGKAGLQLAPGQNSGHEFTNLGPITGDYGLWRAGDGSALSLLGTVDGYTYAMPLGLVFQRNTGKFDISTNPFGCSNGSSNSGLVDSGVSGRPDNRFADMIYSEDVIDTRMVTQIRTDDPNTMLNRGFNDLVIGQTALKPSRGDGTGTDKDSLGSLLSYSVSVGPNAIPGTDYLGKFDSYMNGFSSDERTFYTTKEITINNKTVGTNGQRWKSGDSFTINLDDTNFPVRSKASIKNLLAQVLVTKADGTKAPALLYQGQVHITGIGTRAASLTFGSHLEGSPFDPVTNSLFVTVGITYPSGSGYDLRVLPQSVAGGNLYDSVLDRNLPVFGISEYDISKTYEAASKPMVVFNPNYSATNFGARVTLPVPSSQGVRSARDSGVTTIFSIPRLNILGKYTGLYVVSVKDNLTGKNVPIINGGRNVTATDTYVELQADYALYHTSLLFTIQLVYTCAVNYNAPVKGALGLEETVVVGGNVPSSWGLSSDPRLKILDTKFTSNKNTIIIGSTDCVVRGIGGNDLGVKYIFVSNVAGDGYTAYQLSDAQMFNGIITLTMPNDVINLETRSWFVMASILPAFSVNSSLVLSSFFVPYQGEGVTDREYAILYSEDGALVTTNGTGASPIPGIRDVYPFNRELPISTSLPAQSSWKDSDLVNQPITVQFDTNYEAKRQSNVEHTVKVPLHTNDFIEPLTGWKRKTIRLKVPTDRGFAAAFPHVGFAIRKPEARNVLGDSVLSTAGPITLYVSNTVGLDANDGLTASAPKATIQAALGALPPVLRHPVTIYLMDTGKPFLITSMLTSNVIRAAVIGSGSGRQSPKNYCVFSLSFELQDAGRLLISKEPLATSPVEISALGYAPLGDGPMSAFVVDDARVAFNGLKFTNFVDPAIRALDSDLEFTDCEWANCVQAAALEEGSGCILNGGMISLAAGATGFVVSDSELTVNDVQLKASGLVNAFFVATYNSNIVLRKHLPTQETGILTTTPIVLAKLNSSVVCSADFESKGYSKIYLNSILTKSTTREPFQGGVRLGSTNPNEKDNSIMNTDLS
jgi:hypothetical protein